MVCSDMQASGLTETTWFLSGDGLDETNTNYCEEVDGSTPLSDH